MRPESELQSSACMKNIRHSIFYDITALLLVAWHQRKMLSAARFKIPSAGQDSPRLAYISTVRTPAPKPGTLNCSYITSQFKDWVHLPYFTSLRRVRWITTWKCPFLPFVCKKQSLQLAQLLTSALQTFPGGQPVWLQCPPVAIVTGWEDIRQNAIIE